MGEVVFDRCCLPEPALDLRCCWKSAKMSSPKDSRSEEEVLERRSFDSEVLLFVVPFGKLDWFSGNVRDRA